MSDETEFRPDWGVPPGDILREILRVRGMTQLELASRMGRPAQAINQIVKDKKAITAETAIQLEETLGVSARFWLGLEADYRLHLARKARQGSDDREDER